MEKTSSSPSRIENIYDALNTKIFRGVIFFYSILTLVYYCFDYNYSKNLPLNLYNLLCIVPIFLIFVWYKRGPLLFDCETKKELLFLLIAALASVLVKYLYSCNFSTWGDEIYQAWFSNREIFEVSFDAQQPHVATFFNYFGQRLFGISVFGIRSFNLLFHGILLVIFYSFLRSLGVSHLIAASSVILLFLNPIVFRYGIEGRPYNYALVASIFFLSALKQVVTSEKSFLIDFVYLTVTSAFLLMTISLQSSLFIFSIGLSILLFYRNRNIYFAAGAVIVGFLIATPILLEVIGRNQSYLKNGMHLSLVNLYSNLNILIESYFFSSQPLFCSIFIIGICIILLGCFRTKLFATPWPSIFFLQAFIFAFGIFLVFDSTILWKFSSRYIILFILPLLAFVALILNAVNTSKLVQRNVILAFGFQFLIFFGLICGIYYTNPGSPEKVNSRFNVEDWMAPYKEIAIQSTQKDIILTLCPNYYNCGHHPLLIQFASALYPNTSIFQKNYYQNSIHFLADNKPNNIFLIIEDRSPAKPILIDTSKTSLFNYYGIKLLVFRGSNAISDLEKFSQDYKGNFKSLPFVDDVFKPTELAILTAKKIPINWKAISEEYKSNYFYFKAQFFDLAKAE